MEGVAISVKRDKFVVTLILLREPDIKLHHFL
jgi:hypothetical protein